MLVGTLFFSVMSVFAKLAGERLPTMELVLARVVVTLIMSWWAIRRIGIYPWGNNKKLLSDARVCRLHGAELLLLRDRASAARRRDGHSVLQPDARRADRGLRAQGAAAHGRRDRDGVQHGGRRSRRAADLPVCRGAPLDPGRGRHRRRRRDLLGDRLRRHSSSRLHRAPHGGRLLFPAGHRPRVFADLGRRRSGPPARFRVAASTGHRSRRAARPNRDHPGLQARNRGPRVVGHVPPDRPRLHLGRPSLRRVPQRDQHPRRAPRRASACSA